MADWPRSIRPEDRIKYLINARGEMNHLAWETWGDALFAVTSRNERVWVVTEKDVYQGWYGSTQGPDLLVGEFDSMPEVQKALIDHLVVSAAVSQAWEDVAS